VYYRVVDAKYLDGHRVAISFQDGKNGVADLSEYKNRGGVFSNFSDIEYFKKFIVDYGTVVWGDEVDIAPERLYEKSNI